jgi:Lrp/AsnC family leucine-responsive transcriptional regulator
MPKLDTLDERILSALQDDGRLTMKALAEQIGMSSPAVIERVRRLEERGMLTGYRGLVDPTAVGRPLSVIISATVSQPKQEEFLSLLRGHDAAEEVVRVSGVRNFMIRAHFAGTAEIVLSIPVQDSPIMPPPDVVTRRLRATRRRRSATEN